MIMLSAAAKVTAPGLSARLEADSTAFHAALARDKGESIRAAAKLAATARSLSDAFAARNFSRSDTLAILDTVLTGELARRYTDYTGGYGGGYIAQCAGQFGPGGSGGCCKAAPQSRSRLRSGPGS
jgi:hypothetical protein